jgi:transcriptional regulator with XRE-family HTH domain
MRQVPRKKGSQVHPKGPLIDIDEAERNRIRDRRNKLEMQQDELARLAKTTPATISNLEGGRSKQVRRVVYFKVLQVLKLEEMKQPTSEAGELLEQIVEGAAQLDVEALKQVEGMVKLLAKTRKSGAS